MVFLASSSLGILLRETYQCSIARNQRESDDGNRHSQFGFVLISFLSNGLDLLAEKVFNDTDEFFLFLVKRQMTALLENDELRFGDRFVDQFRGVEGDVGIVTTVQDQRGQRQLCQ